MSTAPVRRRLAGVAVLCGLLAALIPETPPLAAQAAGPDVSLLRELRWRNIGPHRASRTKALDGVPHQLCQFHYLREAAAPVYKADRHIKVQLKKRVRGIRPIERQVEGREDAEAGAIRGYCAAVRSALTDDGRPPLDACGLKLQGRLSEVAASLDRAGAKRGSRGS